MERAERSAELLGEREPTLLERALDSNIRAAEQHEALDNHRRRARVRVRRSRVVDPAEQAQRVRLRVDVLVHVELRAAEQREHPYARDRRGEMRVAEIDLAAAEEI